MAVVFVWQRQRGSTDSRSSGKEGASVRTSDKSVPPAVATDPTACGPADQPVGSQFTSAVAARANREAALTKINAFTDWLTNWRRADAAGRRWPVRRDRRQRPGVHLYGRHL